MTQRTHYRMTANIKMQKKGAVVFSIAKPTFRF